MNKAIVMTLSAALLAGAAGVAMADGKKCDEHGLKDFKGGQHEMSGKRMDRLAEHLALNADQKSQIQKIFEEKHEQRKAGMEDRKSFRQQMESLDPESPDYVAQVEKLATEKSKGMVKMAVERAETKAKIYAVLTDEQEEKFEELKEKRGKKGGYGDKHREGEHRH